VSDYIDDLQDATSVTILRVGYRARCARQGCGNLARAILRYADRGGRPFANLEQCNAHARAAIERDTKMRLTVYDDRESPTASPGGGAGRAQGDRREKNPNPALLSRSTSGGRF
jgi:hypothetical protein